MTDYPNLIIIGGSGQNVGKTTLVTDIIKKFSKEKKFIAIKSSSHFHGISEKDRVIVHNDKFTIIQETQTDTDKDSSRMLKAGAEKVFFVQAGDHNLKEAFDFIEKDIDSDTIIISESASLRKHLLPKLFIALFSSGQNNLKCDKKILEKADLSLTDYLKIKIDLKKYLNFNSNNWLNK